MKLVVKPRTLTDCVFDASRAGHAKHLFWKFLINPIRTLRFAVQRPSLGDNGRTVLGALRSAGIAIGPARDVLSDDGAANLAECQEIVRQICASGGVQEVLNAGRNEQLGKKYLVHLVPFDQPQDSDSPFLRFALDPNLIAIVSSYMGMWPQLHSVGAWLNFPTGLDASHSQKWHRDPEDLKIVKVFVYLDDVAVENGPFCYIPGTQPFGPHSGKEVAHEHERRISDEEMTKAFPRDKWIDCVGPAGTMIIADTVGFHRGGHAEEGKRVLITLTYTSGAPQSKRNLRITGWPKWLTEPGQAYALR